MNTDASRHGAPLITFDQIEEALEERANPDRRQSDRGLPENVHHERRRGDRRET